MSLGNPAAHGDERRDPSLFYLPLSSAGPLAGWPKHLDRLAGLGFSHVLMPPPFQSPDPQLLDDPERPHPGLAFDGDGTALLGVIDRLCRAARLGWMFDVRLDGVAAVGRVARERPDVFAAPPSWAAIDPSEPDAPAHLRPGGDGTGFWSELLTRWGLAGAAGFRLRGLPAATPALLADISARVRSSVPDLLLFGALDEVAADGLSAWHGTGLDRIEIALERWDEQADGLVARAMQLAGVAPLLAVVERPFGPRFAAAHADRQGWLTAARLVVQVASELGDGWLMPAGFADGERMRMVAQGGQPADLAADVPPALAEAVRAGNVPSVKRGRPGALPVTRPGVNGWLRRQAETASLTLVNRRAAAATLPLAGLVTGLVGETGLTVAVASGELRNVALHPAPLLREARPPRGKTALLQASRGRVAIEQVTPSVDEGRFAAKRTVGDVVQVECDVICDGHDQLAAMLQWRATGQADWRETPMVPLGNDRWRAELDLSAVGRWLFRVAAWRDEFATFRDELGKKHKAGLDVRLEVREGRALVEAAAARAPTLAHVLARLDAGPAPAEHVALLLSEDVAAAMRAADPRPLLVQSPDFPVDADRAQAGRAAWYEIFPRSMSGDGVRHGTFRDVIEQLPRIRDMGFDVLYFPPIHPIGRTNRKGRNNSLTPAADDPGSPYAIGSAEGGHDALHPELGGFEDFEALRQAAAEFGLEIAIDFAIQCAPDHPWLREHKGWFDWRPDGSLRYAENPPKKYEDIVNVDFYAPDAVPGLWEALADVVFFWLERGVRIFRVDNPHTKPFPFWEWLIGEVRAAHPDAVFLAEAFTRPNVMNRLGKVGFHQSYTYFTWRNTKSELQEYLTQIDTTAERDFFRPNFFVNTPDINPPFLQTGGRPAHLIRAALAATLSGSWGVYCGFELCEATPVPGREEYLDSEKYQLRAWDWDRPGNIVAEIARLNALRRTHPCLWSHLGVSFLPSDDEQVMFYEKATADRGDVLLIAVCLDPRGDHSAAIELPLWRWGLSDQATLDCRDVLHDTSFTLTGKWQRVALSPTSPYTIWHARPQGPYTA